MMNWLLCSFLFCAFVFALTPRKIYAAGSGLDMLALNETVSDIIQLSGKSNPRLLYLGTATYDDVAAMNTQTAAFVSAGCSVHDIKIATANATIETLRAAFNVADIILVSGGNTLYANDRFVKNGIPGLLAEAMARGAVLCGGSAGGIVWFDGGHSDSMEPSSYKNPPGPLLNPNMPKSGLDNWAYIRVPGISLIPGLFCPHYDVTEGNGVARSEDFTVLLQQHSGEYGIGVDNWAALMIDGDSYTLISRKGHTGSVNADGSFARNSTGYPGGWQMQIGPTGELQRKLIPRTGSVSNLLLPARYIVDTTMLTVARNQNPDDGLPPTFTSYKKHCS